MTKQALQISGVVVKERSRFGFTVSIFLSMLRRDIVVATRQLVQFLLMALIQPLFFLYVFGNILPSIGLANDQYSLFLVPGIIAMTAFLAGMQTIAFQVGAEFTWTKEVEDRLLSPIPSACIGLEKIILGCLQTVVATVVVTLLSFWVMGSWHQASDWNWWLLIVMTLAAGCSSASIGLTVGTLVNANNVGTIFGMILTPVMFLGGPFYPWELLSEFPVIKILALLNPLLYISEGFRAAFMPDFPHMPLHYAAIGLIVFILLFSILGILGFNKRARQ
ncbi:ABC transporter permease [Paenibacillus dendritiformis]|uniref:ABC transporter permease n=1 Tax=Paenibacillus dendritiformis TaxID=130049 RepID=UPI000DA9513B|nr:ABC transporter permease [Paenibacillus dendritiformis]PZM63232.1 ABC transporter permease [Paenibacillus dendritiformis]